MSTKEKVVGVCILLCLLSLAMFMTPPRAQACWRDCVLIQCADGGSGYQTITDFGNDSYTLTRNPFICRTSCCTETQVYAQCAEFLCSFSAAPAGAPGKLYTIGGDDTDVVELTITADKFEEVSDAINHSKNAESVASKYNLPIRHLTPEQFKNRHVSKSS